MEQAGTAITPAQNSFSYLSADETTADFVKGIFEYGKSIGQVSPVVRYRDADYVTFMDGKAGRTCIGFRRVGRPQRGGYDASNGRYPLRTTREDHNRRRSCRIH